MTRTRLTSALVIAALLTTALPAVGAPAGPAGTTPPASLELRRSARALRADRSAPSSASPWKPVGRQTTSPHHRRGLWIAVGAASGAAGGAFVGAALQSLTENAESLTPSAVVGGAIGALGGGLVAALLTRK